MNLTVTARAWSLTAAGIILLGCLSLFNLTQGEVAISRAQLFHSATFHQASLLHDIIFDFRLPRVVMGILSGAALAMAGALTQSILRNPMVSPGILGISSGSYLFIVLATLFAPALVAQTPLLLTLAGGLTGVLLVGLLAGGFRAPPLRMLLAGMIVSMTLGSLTDALLVMNQPDTRFLLSWGTGMLRQNDWSGVHFALPIILGCFLLIILLAPQLDVALLHEETAQALGQHVRRVKIIAVILILCMTGAIVAVIGPVGFIGLIVPHMVKFSGIRRHRLLLPICALGGALLLTCADTLTLLFGSITQAPPLGAITAMLGAPYLLLMVLRYHPGSSILPLAAPFGFPRLINGSTRKTALCLAAVLILLVMLGCLLSGSYPLALHQVLQALLGSGDPVAHTIVWSLRLPRVAMALLAGACFAIAGVLMQAALRNPLADTAMLGVNNGAAVTLLVLSLFFPTLSGGAITLSALTGGLLAGLLVYLLAWKHHFSPVILILTGMAVTMMLSACIQILVLNSRFIASPLMWLMGGLYGSTWSGVLILLGLLCLCAPIAWYQCQRLDILALGDHSASSLGLSVARTRLLTGGLSIILSAVAVSLTGPVGYIGLLAPHSARLLSGFRTRPMLLTAVLTGAILLLTADILARTVLAPTELPAGAVIALVGAPYLLLLIYRNYRP